MSRGDPGVQVVGAEQSYASTDELLFELPGNGRVLFTARQHGNMSSVGGLDCEHGADARARVRTRHSLNALVGAHQVHGTTVLRIRDRSDLAAHELASDSTLARPRADGHTTSLAHVGLLVLAADCLPIALGSEHGVAIVHAGWRGLAAGVIEEGLGALRELGEGSVAAIVGPGAGACCYEVGQEVHRAFGKSVPDAKSIDLKAIARQRLRAAGVAEVRDLDICTICDERFFSHRREASDAGRQAGIAWCSSSHR